MNITHQQKKMPVDAIRAFRDRSTSRCRTTSWKKSRT
jgi:pyruvate dehydrogenase complex dehydrogenase (E1) component